MATPWWQRSVIYQIYPRSFADGNGDGVGDLAGLRAHADHLRWLGVDGVWLSPIYPSPMADFGYDVSDYCGVDPLFGSLADLDGLLADLHAHDQRLILDWVPNHTSSQHPWFREAASSRNDPRRDFYIWRDSLADGSPPNNWVASLEEGPAWTFHEPTGQWYLHCFLPEQPDLNWANPEVVAAMHEVLRFWLDRGVDGFRADVVHLIGKEPELRDDDPGLLPLPHVVLHHRDETHPLLRDLRRLLDAYEGDRMMVGEVYLLDTDLVTTYYGHDDELHLCFNFPPLHAPWSADAWRRQIDHTMAAHDARGAWPTWVLSNHDTPRHRTRYGGSEARARAAALLLLGLRGTPFLYAGEELGLEDAPIPDDRIVDPGGRDGCRSPIPWERADGHGWSGAPPWLPFRDDASHTSVEAQREDPSSILWLYRTLLAARSGSEALQVGAQEMLDVPDGVVGWRRETDGDCRLVLVNFTDRSVRVTTPEATVTVASDRAGEGGPFSGTLGPDQAVWLDLR